MVFLLLPDALGETVTALVAMWACTYIMLPFYSSLDPHYPSHGSQRHWKRKCLQMEESRYEDVSKS